MDDIDGLLRDVRRLRRKVLAARRVWRLAETASRVGVTRLYGDAIVGDLPPHTLALIGAQSATQTVIDEIDRLKGVPPRARPTKIGLKRRK